MTGGNSDVLKTIQEADARGDSLAVLKCFPDLGPSDGEITLPEGWPKDLVLKVQLLRKLHNMAELTGGVSGRKHKKYAKVHEKTPGPVQVQKVLTDFFAPVFERYMAYGKTGADDFDVFLVSEVKEHLNGDLGTIFSQRFHSLFTGWELKMPEEKQLASAWKLIGHYISRMAKG